MRKKRTVKKYIEQNPDLLEVLKAEADQFFACNSTLKDEDIPSFDAFLSSHNAVAHHYQHHHKEKQPAGHTKPRVKTLQIILPLAALVLMCLFMALTSPGFALADTLYNTIVNWLDNGFSIQLQSKLPTQDTDQVANASYDSFDAAQTALGDTLVRHRDATPAATIDVIRLNEVSYQITSAYQYRGSEIIVAQIVSDAISGWSTSVTHKEGQPISVQTDDGTEYLGSFDDNDAFAVAYTHGYRIEVYSTDVDHDDFVDFLDGLILK